MTTDIPDAEYDLPPLEFADEIETDTAQVLSNVGTLIQDIIWQRKKPRLTIPIQYTDDDLVIGGAINQAEKDLKEAARLIRTLTTENERLKEKLRNSIQMGTQTTRPPLVITGDD